MPPVNAVMDIEVSDTDASCLSAVTTISSNCRDVAEYTPEEVVRVDIRVVPINGTSRTVLNRLRFQVRHELHSNQYLSTSAY